MNFFKAIVFLPIAFLLVTLSGYSQNNIAQFSHENYKRNKVYKCIEYNASDSVNYFKEYPNAMYTIYDREGYPIEKNFYAHFSDPKNHIEKDMERKLFYVYDNKEKELLWLWYDSTSLQKIERVVVDNFDTTGKDIGYTDFRPNSKPTTSSDSNNLNDDSIVSINGNRKKITCYGFYGKPRKDTVYKKTLFYYSNKLDSGRFQAYQDHWCNSSFKYNYKDSTIIEAININDCYHNGQGDTTRTIFYQNGLRKTVYYPQWNSKDKTRYYSIYKFKYLYYKP